MSALLQILRQALLYGNLDQQVTLSQTGLGKFGIKDLLASLQEGFVQYKTVKTMQEYLM